MVHVAYTNMLSQSDFGCALVIGFVLTLVFVFAAFYYTTHMFAHRGQQAHTAEAGGYGIATDDFFTPTCARFTFVFFTIATDEAARSNCLDHSLFESALRGINRLELWVDEPLNLRRNFTRTLWSFRNDY